MSGSLDGDKVKNSRMGCNDEHVPHFQHVAIQGQRVGLAVDRPYNSVNHRSETDLDHSSTEQSQPVLN